MNLDELEQLAQARRDANFISALKTAKEALSIIGMDRTIYDVFVAKDKEHIARKALATISSVCEGKKEKSNAK